MNHSIETGFGFGLTSATITTLGLIVGLAAGTNSKIAVIGGVLTIAVADAASDALGIHISEESENVHTSREVWTSTVATFITKFLFALTFLVPILLLDMGAAIVACIFWGFAALVSLSYVLSKKQGKKPASVIAEHLVIASAVVALTHFLGLWIARTFA